LLQDTEMLRTDIPYIATDWSKVRPQHITPKQNSDLRSDIILHLFSNFIFLG